MNGSSKLSLAVALALIGGNAFALGLGTIQVQSKLNQPLLAEIPVIADSPAEASGLTVSLASAEDFQRVGLSRAQVTVPVEFFVTSNSRGQPIIKVTTEQAVREPFLDFLVEVNWSKGKLLREYTVLLDPPVMAPALKGSTATVRPMQATESAALPQKLASEPAQPKPTPVRAKPPQPVAQAKPTAARPAAPSRPTPAAQTAATGNYGPVAQGETLSEIARATRPDGATVNAMMLAMLKANPDAFFKDNINALKRGAILRIPSHDEISATGSALAVAAAVREQNQVWGANVPVAKPTLVAKTGAPEHVSAAHDTSVSTSKPSEHLSLVPPRAGKGQATADRPGAASGTGVAETHADLARTKEALASRDQEVGDLKSRVKDLENLNGKDQRLIALKQSEIAELQAKLKQMEAAKPATVVATAEPVKPAAAPITPVTGAKTGEVAATPTESAKANTKLTAKDIWGDINASQKNGESKLTGTTTPNAPASVVASTATPAAPPTDATLATNTSVAPAVQAEAPKPSVTIAPVKPTPPAKLAPIAPAELPWWQNNNVLLGGGAVLLIIGLLALMRFMRKPKIQPQPLPIGAGMEPSHADMEVDDDEHHLLDQLASDPGDPHLSLELLSIYYAQRDAEKFEAAAEAMYAHVADPTQPEWQQVRVMGEALCPHNPLFGGQEDFAAEAAYAHDEHTHDEPGEHLGHAEDTLQEFHLGEDTHAHNGAAATADEDGFDFGLTEPEHTPAEPVHDLEFTHAPEVSLHPTPPPPISAPPVASAPTPAPVTTSAEDFFGSDDAIGTKLDLAKAYLDMGDPEGARSMLDEVMAEGNETQKGEARKLLAEIH